MYCKLRRYVVSTFTRVEEKQKEEMTRKAARATTP